MDQRLNAISIFTKRKASQPISLRLCLRGPALLLRPLPVAPPAATLPRLRKVTVASGMTEPVLPKFVPLEPCVEDAPTDSNRMLVHRDGTTCFKFRVVSYNILAQAYVKSSYFPHSPSSCLEWETRSQAILADLKNLNADLLCVQEMDKYNSFYKSIMESYGYAGLYIQRRGEKLDGCGIFYKSSWAELLEKEEIDYNDLVGCPNGLDDNGIDGPMDIESIDQSVDDLSNVRLKRDCVGLLAAFKLSDPSNHIIVVANTHIYWDPDCIDVKLAQARYLISRICQFNKKVSEKNGCVPSVIIAGDFNSTPEDEVYGYLTSFPETASVPLSSLYATNGGEPAFTSCTPGFTATLDYIFVSGNRLKPMSLLAIPGPESDEVKGGLPNHFHPSDHLPIGGELVVS